MREPKEKEKFKNNFIQGNQEEMKFVENIIFILELELIGELNIKNLVQMD